MVAESLAKCLVDASGCYAAPHILEMIERMHRFALEVPLAIDFLLSAFMEASRLFPRHISTDYGRGSQAGLKRLQAWLRGLNGFRGYLSPGSVASVDLVDPSNIRFRYSQVAANLEGVLGEMGNWKRQRKSTIIVAVMSGRAFSAGVLEMEEGRRIEALAQTGLTRRRQEWSKASFISACILLRACGKSLMGNCGEDEAKDKRQRLRSALEGFLLDDCFMVKMHATVSRYSHLLP